MAVATASTLKRLRPVEPFVEEKQIQNGMSYGLSHCGYDVRIKQDLVLAPGEFALASTYEKFLTPRNYVAIVHDKSTWARKGLTVQNTVIEPGFVGFLTLELTNHSKETVTIAAGDPISQIIWHELDQTVEGYKGKYQDQEDAPVEARYEECGLSNETTSMTEQKSSESSPRKKRQTSSSVMSAIDGLTATS